MLCLAKSYRVFNDSVRYDALNIVFIILKFQFQFVDVVIIFIKQCSNWRTVTLILFYHQKAIFQQIKFAHNIYGFIIIVIISIFMLMNDRVPIKHAIKKGIEFVVFWNK